MLSFRTGSLQYQLSSHNAQKKMQKILDTHKISGNSATQQLDCALINGRFFHSDNDIIIFSHQFLQTTTVLLGFFILNRKGR